MLSAEGMRATNLDFDGGTESEYLSMSASSVSDCALPDLLELFNCVVIVMGGRRCETDWGDIIPLDSDAHAWVSIFLSAVDGLPIGMSVKQN